MNVFKTYRKNTLGILLVISTLALALASGPAYAGNGNGAGVPTLTAEEADMLTYMREEEKLARDVYLVMFDTWDAAIFTQIAESEQQHMDTMQKKLDKYGLPDPATETIGLFTNTDLQEKYDELVAAGTASFTEGLYVGATIEEIDMVDIQYAIDITTHLDLETAYQNLLEGSKNHLRAYVGALENQGVLYTPQYISQELFDAIMDLQ